MPYTEYITNEGDRLDMIAYKAYGDPFAWADVLQANSALPIQAEYPAGIRVMVPILEQAAATQPAANLLPPWKR
jgi:phage tail protein X